MCDPGTIILAASAAISIGKDVAGYIGGQKKLSATEKAANASAQLQTRQLTLREGQEQDAAGQSIMQADRQARFADAEARVQAGESGVKGASVDALLHDIQNKDSAYKVATTTNLNNELQQTEMEKMGIRVNAANEITQAKNNTPTGLDLALGIGGDVLGVAGRLIRPSSGGSTTAAPSIGTYEAGVDGPAWR